MTPTPIPASDHRPEYSRLERRAELGFVYLELGRPERALGHLEKFLKWYPSNIAAVVARGRAISDLKNFNNGSLSAD